MSFYHNPRIITDGLVFMCDPTNYKSYRSGSSILYDLSGNGYHGTITGNPQITGSFFNFDGDDDEINWTNIYNHQSSSTIECWFNIDTYQSESAGIIGYLMNGNGGYSDNSMGGLCVSGTLPEPLTETAGLEFSLITDTQTYRQVKTVVTKNEWHLVALDKDMENGIMNLYIDTELRGTNTFDETTYAQWPDPGTYIGSNNNFGVGYFNSSNTANLSYPSRHFKGKIATTRIYNRILTDDEKKQNYIATKGRFK